MKEPTIPKAKFRFGQKVRVYWREAGGLPSIAWVTGIHCNPNVSERINYTVAERNDGRFLSLHWAETEIVDEGMLEAVDDERLAGVCTWKVDGVYERATQFQTSCGKSPSRITGLGYPEFCEHCGKKVEVTE